MTNAPISEIMSAKKPLWKKFLASRLRNVNEPKIPPALEYAMAMSMPMAAPRLVTGETLQEIQPMIRFGAG